MKTVKRYFTLRDTECENPNIGTVVVDIVLSSRAEVSNLEEANQQFNGSVRSALRQHFDAECLLEKELDVTDYLDTYPEDVNFVFEDEYGEQDSGQLEISQTWVY